MKNATPTVNSAYRQCSRMIREHLKKQIPAFWILSSKDKPPLAAIFALEFRINSILHKKSLSHNRRKTLLDQLETDIHLCLMGEDESDDPVIIALADAIPRYDLSMKEVNKMIGSGKKSLENNQFNHFADLISYCKDAANPQGVLILKVLGESDAKSEACVKALTTSLFLMDKYQHIGSQYKHTGSVFLPQDDMQRFNVTDTDLTKNKASFNYRQLMRYEYARIDKLLRAAAPIGKSLNGRAGMVTRMILTNAARKLYHLKTQEDLSKPVKSNKGDWKYIMKSAFG